ncbi:hypothetical protein [Bacillus sp. S/N-304-OC-R1]|uniref:TolB family protein n=1 Tax=Bacillus sp. S/N-304-OC-R1 TaxID=2758034 RepID=UPI001C8DDFA7|nr:hypothetical protein [Bacillus sp. S/N-304-OC-R1]MBY0122788.1 hypothetical protein [Bacillus sp. S/N-304-OC-R1]
MKKKFQGLAVITLVGFVAAGCSLTGKADMQKTVTINDNVQLESSLADSSLAVTHEKSVKLPIKADYTGFHGDKIYFNQDGGAHLINTETLVKKKLADKPFFAVSENGNRALSLVNQKIYVLDFQTNSEKLIGHGTETYPYYFADADGKEVIHVESGEQIKVHVMNVDTSEAKTWEMNKWFETNNFTLTSVKKDENGIYVAAQSKEHGKGLYHLDYNDKLKVISTLADINSMDYYDFIGPNQIIFSDLYKGKSGVFLMNLQSNEVTQLVAGGKDEEGIWVPFYKLSPDHSKILFDTPVQVENEYKTNVYMAELENNKIKNTVRILENADLYAVISLTGSWSANSKTAYISTSKPGDPNIHTVEIFNLQ